MTLVLVLVLILSIVGYRKSEKELVAVCSIDQLLAALFHSGILRKL
jgi:hypothetical protein